ncbi:uncharacterized protein LOC120451425 [Drosophila santomea]|uniref:uncharacterized protein LOC120451425 n=1 Tax=Drosophila santomea TaxID=129105 RepID=UPI001953F963|nr:uncharacterized protein LOC120451425 [Drosophila santomea]
MVITLSRIRFSRNYSNTLAFSVTSAVSMSALNLLYILLFNTMFKDVVSIKTTLCRRHEAENPCVEKNTWVFDQNARTCNPVTPDKEPCGHFISEKACKEVCLQKKIKKFWSERLLKN